MNVFDRLDQRALEEWDRIRRMDRIWGTDINPLVQREFLASHSAAYETVRELTRNPAYRFAIENATSTALTETARAASLKALDMSQLNQSRVDLAMQMNVVSQSWLQRASLFNEPTTVAVKSALDSHIARISQMSVLAESSLARFNWDEIGSSIHLPTSARDILRDDFLRFSHSYEFFVASLNESQPIILSLPPIASEIAAREYFLGSRLVKSVSVVTPDDDLEEESEDLQQELYAAVEQDLRSLAAQLDSGLVVMIDGARSALRSSNPDRIRHVLTSYRELCTHVLHFLSPDDAIKEWSNSPDDYSNGRPTRKARMRYICRNINHGPFTGFMEKDIETMVKLFDLLNQGTHQITTSFTDRQIDALRNRAESTVHFMLMMIE
jgi:hypothetical protein